MATFIQAVDRFSEAMGIPRTKLMQVGRIIREGDPSLIPHDPIGRNKSTHLTPIALWSLMIGAAAADPVVDAVAIVRAYRQAEYQTPLGDLFRGKPERSPILSGQTLGVVGEALINLLATPSEQERARRREFLDDFRITLTVGEALVATVERPAHGMVDTYDAQGFVGENAPDPATFRLQLHDVPRRVKPLRRVVHVEFEYFEVAAELWANSLARGTSYQPSLLEPPVGGLGIETAATVPLPGNDAAALSDQPAQTELGTSQPHSMVEREKTQPAFKSHGGRSRPFDRSVNHDRRHYDPHGHAA